MDWALGVIYSFVLLALPTALLFLGVRAIWYRFLQRRLQSAGGGNRAFGECVNLRWTTKGWVSSGVRYTDARGLVCTAWTDPAPTVRIPVGKRAEVLYDPRHRAPAIVAGDVRPRGSYVVGTLACLLGLAGVGGLGFLIVR